MDDMWLFGDDPAQMRRAQTELQDAARALGMNINSAKTALLEGDAVAEKALEIEHSAVDDALDNRQDKAPLEELIDKLLENPDTASRTSLKFAATRMREHNNRHRVREFAQLAERMPHAADALMPLFKDAFTHGSLQDWFLEYAKSDWASYQWSVGQYVRLFPSNVRPRKALRDWAASMVDDSDSSLPMLAVAAQRLAAWDPGEARAVIRSALSRSAHPQNRRALVLAALSAGEPRATVRKWMAQEPENHTTLELLKHVNFVAPKVIADYEN